jgi:hypothetical protein
MIDLDYRTGWLLQIPSEMLKALVVLYVPLDCQKTWLKGQDIGFRDPTAALNRLTVEQLIRLINAYPEEVPDAVVEAEFKEYRHGRSPTLHLYTVPTVGLEGFDLQESNRRLQRAAPRADRELEQTTQQEDISPRLRGLEVEDLQALDDWPAGLHTGYQVQSRLDYIATDGRAASTYQLFYGHIWIDLGRAFIALHVHPAKLEPVLVWLLTQALNAPLLLVRIDKELKHDLKFLQRASCRRARLVDPTPDRQRFRSITLADDDDLARRRYLEWDYQQWENDFPELASARYYAQFLGVRKKPLSLSIGLRRGSLTLAGAVAAGELSAWARDTGAQIVDVWRARERRYREMAPAVLDHKRLAKHVLLEGWPDELRELVLRLVRALATIKERQDPLFQSWPLSVDTADLALTTASTEAQELLGLAARAGGPAPWFQVMVRTDCSEEYCTSTTEYLVCPSCGQGLFTLDVSKPDGPILACTYARCREHWQGGFPLQTQCEEGHLVELKWDETTSPELELFVGSELAFLMQELLKEEAEVYHFQFDRESLWVRDGALVHRPVRPDYEIRRAREMMTNIFTGGGTAIVGDVHVERGDFVARDQHKAVQQPAKAQSKRVASQ